MSLHSPCTTTLFVLLIPSVFFPVYIYLFSFYHFFSSFNFAISSWTFFLLLSSIYFTSVSKCSNAVFSFVILFSFLCTIYLYVSPNWSLLLSCLCIFISWITFTLHFRLINWVLSSFGCCQTLSSAYFFKYNFKPNEK